MVENAKEKSKGPQDLDMNDYDENQMAQQDSVRQMAKKLVTSPIDTELGTVAALGEKLERSTLHQDPFQNLALSKEHDKMIQDMGEKLKRSKQDRERLKETLID